MPITTRQPSSLSRHVSRARRLQSEESGNIIITFALLLPVVLGTVGAAVDYGFLAHGKSRLQGLADSAAIGSAREMQMARSDASKIAAVAESYVKSAEPQATVETVVKMSGPSVTVTVTKFIPPTLGISFFNTAGTVKAQATAQLSSNMPLCLLALEQSAPGAVYLEKNAQMLAPGCMVYSNSSNKSGLQSKNDAALRAGMICSAGGKVKTKPGNMTPDPLLDCPVLADPFRSRQVPTDSTCKHTGMVVSGTIVTLQPGVYCGGLTVTAGAQVTLGGGIYIFKDGPLIVNGGGQLRGEGVAIYLRGIAANLTFDVESTISLSAPKSGLMAGFLIFDDLTGASAPAIPPAPEPPTDELGGKSKKPLPREHKILSSNARNLLGTIYMPKARLIIGASSPIADKSAYTVIVVGQVTLYEGPTLVLNSDYTASDVPVPPGVGPFGNNVFLSN